MNYTGNLFHLQSEFDAADLGSRYGLQCGNVQRGAITSWLRIDARHRIEPQTFVHGGCLAAVCEQTNRFTGRSTFADEPPMCTTELHLSYLAGASGTQLCCDASIVAAGHQGVIVESRVHSGDEQPDLLVASCRSVVARADVSPLCDLMSLEAADQALPPVQHRESSWRRWIREDFGQGWREYCGIVPSNAGLGFVELSHQPQPLHLDDQGFVLRSLVAPFADAAGGACAYTTVGMGERLATLDLTLSVLNRPVVVRALLARARAIKIGKRVVVSRTDVFALNEGSEQLLATGFVTVIRVPGHERVISRTHPALPES